LDFAVLSFASLIVIVDPVGLVPPFLAMTEGRTAEDRVRTSALASGVTFAILVLFSFFGRAIFKSFGISLPAFEVAGGVILLVIALDMLRARPTAVRESPEEQAEGMSKEEIAIFPLAIPMLAGPGAITAVTLLAQRAVTLEHRLVLLGNIALVSLASFLILRFAARRSSSLSVIVLKITTRLMGLMLASIAVQFILNGVRVFFGTR
jgi:multiple antibiotic resistance protein